MYKTIGNRRLFITGAVMAALSVQLAASELTLYVSTKGSDNSSGRQPLPEAAPEGPLATLPAALELARKNAAAPGSSLTSVKIFLRGGVYELAAPILIKPLCEDTNRSISLEIASYRDEHPTLSGGRRIAGWKPVPGKPGQWQVEIPEVKSGQWYFRQLFANDQRQIRARHPNTGFFRIQGDSPGDSPIKLKFNDGDIRKEYAQAEVEVIAYLAWADIRMFIRSVDEEGRVAVLSGNPQRSNRENNAQYYLENALAFLDAPGEWFLDRSSGLLTCWARPGENPNETEVVAPRLTELMRLEGDLTKGNPLRHVTLKGLTFAHSDWTIAAEGYADVQAAVGIHGDIIGEGVTESVIENCRFTHLGGYALEFGRGCQKLRIRNNEISDMGAGGIRLGEQRARTNSLETNFGHEVTGNHIHHLGEVYKPAIGVIVFQSGQNRIAYNHIHDLYYTAISVGWNWGYQETPCRDNLVEFNHLHDIGKGLLSDMGAIYTLGIQRGTVIRNNLIHDVNAFTYGGWGIYPDEGSTYLLIENNIVYRTKSAGFHQHYGRENIVRNNIFAFGRENQLMRSRAEPHLSFTFEKNIVYFDSGNLLGSNWNEDRYEMDHNLYFDTRAGADPARMKFAGQSLEQWRARGHDRNSVLADPLFLDAQHYDFRLKSDSPALKLGFKPIDLSQAGKPKNK